MKVEPETRRVAEEDWRKTSEKWAFHPKHFVEATKMEEPEVKKELEKAIVEGLYDK